MVHFLAATIMLFIHRCELHKRFLWSYNGDVPRNVSIPKRSWEKGIYPSNKATNQNLGSSSVVRRTSKIQLNDCIFFVCDFVALEFLIVWSVDEVRRNILKNRMVFM